MPVKRKRRKRRPLAGRTYVAFFLIFAALIFISHAGFLNLPLYWDEAGQFVPAASVHPEIAYW